MFFLLLLYLDLRTRDFVVERVDRGLLFFGETEAKHGLPLALAIDVTDLRNAVGEIISLNAAISSSVCPFCLRCFVEIRCTNLSLM